MSRSPVRKVDVVNPKNTAPAALQRLDALAPYQQGKCEIPGRDRVIKLSSNESCFGPSPAAQKAYLAMSEQLHRYPDGSQAALRAAIAAVHGIDPDRIVCGNGSEEVIGLLIRCFLSEEDELLLSENHFMMCSIYGKGQGARVVLAPERDFKVDVDSLLSCITPKTRVLSVANPNNPTGTYLPASEISRLLDAVPENVLVILDGAYAEYVDRADYDSGLAQVEQRQNLVVTGSFSKIYGLAGLRIGWGYGPARIIEMVNRLRTPFNTNAAALAAATAALGDQEHVRRTREHTARWQEQIAQELTAMGLVVVPSVTNFYLLDFSGVKNKSAREAAEFLERHGIIPRPGKDERFLRITIGTDEENQAVLDTLSEYLST